MAPSDAFADTLTEAPGPVRRPALARWIWERNLTWRDAGRLLGVSHEAARCYCHPFGDPNRRRPDEATRARIDLITRGEVPPGSFDEPSREHAA